MTDDPLAYFITWTVYGTFLQGDARWWRARQKGKQPPQPRLEQWHRDRLKHDVVLLTESHRDATAQEIARLSDYRNWKLWGANSRTNHVHVVVTATEHSGKQVRDQMKANCTRVLREIDPRFVDRPVWTVGGDWKCINTKEDLEQAILYAGEAQERTSRGRPWKNHRTVISGILWILVTGCLWRNLPEEFGKWQTVYGRYRRWVKEGLIDRIFSRLLTRLFQDGKIDLSLWCVDGSVIRAHRSASGGSKQSPENDRKNGLGRSTGGYSTKLHLLTDRIGNILSVTATPGQSHESQEFENLLLSSPLSLHRIASRPDAVAGDKGYSSGNIRNWLNKRQIKDVIPTKVNEKRKPRFPQKRYQQRNIVERTMGWLKEMRRIATRYDKLVESYLGFIKLAAIRWLAIFNKQCLISVEDSPPFELKDDSIPTASRF